MSETKFIKDGEFGIDISHHFSGKGYAKVYSAPAGLSVHQHKHKTAHDSHLLLGIVDVTVDGVTTRYEAPAVVHVKADAIHQIVSVTDFLWACVWPDVDGVTDPDEIDHEVVA